VNQLFIQDVCVSIKKVVLIPDLILMAYGAFMSNNDRL
jgi:hypothetical protein